MRRMNKNGMRILLIALVSILAAAPGCRRRTGFDVEADESESFAALARYNIVWDSPSKDYSGTMPLGNGDIGVNVWWETNGDLQFYIGKTDSWEDNSRLAKVGKVRVRFTPDLFRSGASGSGTASTPPVPFLQTLNLGDATVKFTIGRGDDAVHVHVWADANHPVIHVSAEAGKPVSAAAVIEPWRTERMELASSEVGDPMYETGKPGNSHGPVFVEPDTLVRASGDPDSPAAQAEKAFIGWYHHNTKSVGPALAAELQDMRGYGQDDPILDRTFGAVIKAGAGVREDEKTLLSPSAKSHVFSVYVLTRHPSTPGQWLSAMDGAIAETEKIPFEKRREAHEAWWREFWTRSWLRAEPAGGKTASGEFESSDAFVVSRAYALQRFITACAGRGAFPIKFNGSLFTVPYPGTAGDADYRRWGSGYWWQNSRLPYLASCAAGDFDLMQPFFRMYAGDMLDMAKYRTRHYFGHGGAYLNECAYFWGAAFNESYGWTPREKRETQINESRWHRWEWQGGLELLYMMLDYYEHTLDEGFLVKALLPSAREILTFYNVHYDVDENEKMIMDPGQALETWWESRNPMPEVAGLQAVTERLLALPSPSTPGITENDRRLWERVQAKIPVLPTHLKNGVLMLAPAEKFANKQNLENPELYAVFPYRRIAAGKPGIELGIEALRAREDKGNFGWRQDDIFMAYLGLAEEARAYLAGRAGTWDKESRFPAFWGPNYDWTPDQDHGGVLMKAFQAMLLQTDGRKICLLPAWPKGWNADFKLHAPFLTVIRGRVEDGRLARLDVTPASRRPDVVCFAGD